MPLPIEAGRLGIARTIACGSPSQRRKLSIDVPAAIEMTTALRAASA